jgi:hypothetical protein
MSAARLRRDPKFRRMVTRLHRLGPRPVGELLLELIEAHGIEADVLARLEDYATLDPAMVDRLDGRDWPPLPIRRAA